MSAGDLITSPWQVEWRAGLLGWPATDLVVTDVTGWFDKPPMRIGNVDRAGQHGQFLGSQKASARTVTVEFADIADDPAAFHALLDACATGEDDGEEPLVIFYGPELSVVSARMDRLAVPTGHDYSVGKRTAVAQWTCTDPRRYALASGAGAVGLVTTPLAGVHFPLVFPLVFGAGNTPNTMSLVVGGSVPTWPTWTIRGPVSGPQIRNVDTGQVLGFDIDYTIPDGGEVVIDTLLRSVTYNGVSQRTRLARADWFPLPPASTTRIQFTAATADPAALLAVTWRDAKM